MKREIILLIVAVAVALGIGAWLFLGSAPQVQGGPVTFTILMQGQDAQSFEAQANYRIKTQEDFQALWEMLYPSSAPELPTVDFNANEVLVLMDGMHPTGGYAINAESVVDGETRNVRIVHHVPGETCVVSEQVTYPYQIIVLPKTVANLAHEDVIQTVTCE